MSGTAKERPLSNPVRFTGALLDLLESKGVKKVHLQRLFSDKEFCERVASLLREPAPQWYDSVELADPLPHGRVEEFLAWASTPGGLSQAPPKPELERYYGRAELVELFKGLSDRDEALVIMYWGLDGRGRRSEQQLSEAFSVGVQHIKTLLRRSPGRLMYQHRLILDRAAREEAERLFREAPDPITKDMLPERPYNRLQRAGIRTLSELCKRTSDDILAIENMGQKAHDEIVAMLTDRGLSLKAA